jgi:4-amino-4-deoxy-L-arabinose transferase-like glycosyltransferase
MKFGKLRISSALIVFLLAFGLRLWQNTTVPASPYWEEVALGYDAYSILQTGRDHHGNFLPLVAFPSFGDYKPSMYFYSVVPSIAVFGLNTFAVRFPAVLFSSLTVLGVYLLVQRWAKPSVAFWSAFLLAIQPWSWQVGRVGFEVNLAVMLLTWGVYLLVRATDTTAKQKQFWLWSVLAATSFVLAMYSYHAARLLAPLFAGVTVLLSTPPKQLFQLKTWLKWLPIAGFAVLLLIPLLLAFASPVVQQRFQETSIFSEMGPIEASNQARELSGNTVLSRIFFHRYVFWGKELLVNYLQHLSPQFLFGQGDSNLRHTSQLFGALYPWEIITLFVGIATVRQWFKKPRYWQLLVALTLASPIAATLTLATPHALRALPLSVWLSVWSGIGVATLLEMSQMWRKQISKKLPFVTLPTWLPGVKLVGIGLLSWLILWSWMNTQWKVEYASEWQYGYQQLFEQLNALKQENEPVYVSRTYGRPAMYLFFMTKVDPKRVQAAESTATKDQQEFLEFEDWHFVDGGSTKPGLHAMPAGQTPEGVELLGTVDGLKGEKLWSVYRVSK